RIAEKELDLCLKVFTHLNFRQHCPSSQKNGLITILNRRQGRFNKDLDKGIVIKDEHGRLLITNIIINEQSINIGNIYCPANNSEWVDWIMDVILQLKESSIKLQVLGGILLDDLSSSRKVCFQSPPKEIIEAFNKLMETLAEEGDKLTDTLKVTQGGNDRYTHYNKWMGASRVDRIYLSKEWMGNAEGYRTLEKRDPGDEGSTFLYLNTYWCISLFLTHHTEGGSHIENKSNKLQSTHKKAEDLHSEKWDNNERSDEETPTDQSSGPTNSRKKCERFYLQTKGKEYDAWGSPHQMFYQ
ncbi:hypothetical protein GcC1_219038, partial [Golovinomyces cichoracearum]